MHSPYQLILFPFQIRASTGNKRFSWMYHQGETGYPVRKMESARCKALQHDGRPLILMPLELAGPTNRCTNRINKDNAQGPVPASSTSKASAPRAVPYRRRASQQIELRPPQSPREFLCWIPSSSWWEGPEWAAGQVLEPLEPLWRSGK